MTVPGRRALRDRDLVVLACVILVVAVLQGLWHGGWGIAAVQGAGALVGCAVVYVIVRAARRSRPTDPV